MAKHVCFPAALWGTNPYSWQPQEAPALPVSRLKTDSISGTGTAWGCPRCCCGRPRRAQGFKARSSLVLVLQLCLRACLGLALSDHIAGRVGKEPRRPTRSKHLQEAFHTRSFCVPQEKQLEKREAAPQISSDTSECWVPQAGGEDVGSAPLPASQGLVTCSQKPSGAWWWMGRPQSHRGEHLCPKAGSGDIPGSRTHSESSCPGCSRDQRGS